MIDTKKLKPFDEAAALRGEPVCTLHGKPVTQLKKFDTYAEYLNLAGVCDGHISVFRDSDLRMVPKVREVWVRVELDKATGDFHSLILQGKGSEEVLNSMPSTNYTGTWIGPAVKAGEVEE